MKKIPSLKRILLILALIFYSGSSFSQTKISDSKTPPIPNNGSNALLELESNSKGLLISRVTLIATNKPDPLKSHTAGMVVYNNVISGTAPYNVAPGIYFNDGSKWIPAIENLGNHMATQTLDLANNNIVNIKKATTSSLAIKTGTDGSIPAYGKLAIAANDQGDMVWIAPDKMPTATPAPSAIYEIIDAQTLLGGGAGLLSVIQVKEVSNSTGGKVTLGANSKITFKPGKYKIDIVLSLIGKDAATVSPYVHSYFVDFPHQTGRIRIHQNQIAATSGLTSNHGINISSAAILTGDLIWTIQLGRGQAGNYTGTVITDSGSFLVINRLPD